MTAGLLFRLDSNLGCVKTKKSHDLRLSEERPMLVKQTPTLFSYRTKYRFPDTLSGIYWIRITNSAIF
jgi:hypothetical protein